MQQKFDFFFRSNPESRALFEVLHSLMLEEFPDVEVLVQKTQINYKHHLGFAFISLPRRKKDARGIMLTIGLPDRLDSPRVHMSTEPYPGRWTTHFLIFDPAEFDDELIFWLQRAYKFAER